MSSIVVSSIKILSIVYSESFFINSSGSKLFPNLILFPSSKITFTFKSSLISFDCLDVIVTSVKLFLDKSSIFSTFISLPSFIIPTLSHILDTSFKICVE